MRFVLIHLKGVLRSPFACVRGQILYKEVLMHVKSTRNLRSAFVSDKLLSTHEDPDLRAAFNAQYTEHPERMGASGFWIVPALLISLGLLYASEKFLFWLVSLLLGW